MGPARIGLWHHGASVALRAARSSFIPARRRQSAPLSRQIGSRAILTVKAPRAGHSARPNLRIPIESIGIHSRRSALNAQPYRLEGLTLRDRQYLGSMTATGHAIWPTTGPRNPVITRQASAHSYTP